MIKKLLLLSIALILSNFTYSQSEIEAEKALMNREFSKAKKLYSELLQKDPANSDYYLQRGEANFYLNLIEESLGDYNKSIELNNKSSDAYDKRAFLYFSLNYFDYAILDCNEGLKHIKENKELQNSLLNIRADSYRIIGPNQNAYNDYKKILENNPENGLKINCYVNIAKVLSSQNKTPEAIKYLEELTKSFPEFTVGHVNLAFQYSKNEQYEKSIEENNLAENLIKNKIENKIEGVEIKSETSLLALVYNNRGYAKYKIYKYWDAIEDVNKSLFISPENSYAYRNKALIYFAIDKKDQGCQAIEKAIELKFVENYGDEILILQKKHCK
ncbi:tetratricopeptide repeat protein [Aureivirga sp. CE67]|uniref:tetratricopeptide repeat protein n=1 Tax=Aureivirga sp. CE67 TaxID=1788983 RepID=UPI0018C97051|nr:hypothetical protein [Aureivirga sp. CE67]